MLIKNFLLKILNLYIRKSKLLVNLFFGIKVPDGKRIYWDFTTLALQKALNENVTPKSRILEIGAGPYALLSIYLNKKYGCINTASDINGDYVLESEKALSINNCNFELIKSDLFENIKGRFDIIFFNSVYIPRKAGLDIGLNNIHEYESDWCGGESGIEITKRFLSEARLYLRPFGIILLGFNPAYLKEEETTGLCKECGFGIVKKYKKILNPSIVLKLK